MCVACLPEQEVEPASEGAVGEIVKWAPASVNGDPALFRLRVAEADPHSNLGGPDGDGFDLEEYEVRALLAQDSVYQSTRGNLRRRLAM